MAVISFVLVAVVSFKQRFLKNNKIKESNVQQRSEREEESGEQEAQWFTNISPGQMFPSSTELITEKH